jgi:hypothetical protein
VLADLRRTAPDLILHGGDLAHGGAHPVEIIARIRDLGWHGVLGNTDEMLFRPEALHEFAAQNPSLKTMFDWIEEMAEWTRQRLPQDSLDWLRALPLQQARDSIALVHASPESCWRAPGAEASDAELQSVYSPFGKPLAVYGHIHRSFIRKIRASNSGPAMTVANSGSVSLSHDGDPRAAYLLIDDGVAQIRRVDYDVEKEIQSLTQCGMPHAEWIERALRAASPQMP